VRWARVLVAVAVALTAGACTAGRGASSASAGTFATLAIASSAAPSPRLTPAMAYYPPDQDVVLFGGDSGTNSRDDHGIGDTWVFDARGWHQLHPAHSPPAREGGLMVYDPATRLLMLFGGYAPQLDPASVLSDTWAWNGADWHRLNANKVPTWMPGASIAFDTATGYITELAPPPGYAGSFAPVATFNGDGGPIGRWLWTGTTWLYRAEDPAPPMIQATLVDDLPSGDLLFFGVSPDVSSCGGIGSCRTPPDPTNTRESQTWLWNGARFSQAAPSLAPDLGSLVVSDPRINRVVAIEPSGRVLAWTGSTWASLETPTGPDAGGSAAYDAALGDVVVFGSRTNTASPTNLTWLWTGSRWTPAP
jgi:hypothetical protein